MTRVLANYSDDRIRAVVITQLECNPGAHHQLIADLAAEVLTGGSGDDAARENASGQVMAWFRRGQQRARRR